MIIRSQCHDFIARLQEPRRTIQVVAGPRQVGKTTMVKQALQQLEIPSRFFNADGVDADDKEWIATRWEEVRALLRFNHYDEIILAIDEIHKISNWSEQIKREWDDDTFHDVNIKLVLLGSSRLLLKKGLTESLAGRFEIIPMGHWSFAEMHEAFGWNINQYVYFGGYPGSAPYINNETRWRKYMRESIISPAIEKDVLQTTFIYKPALMHQLFHLGCAYSGELLSYNKMLGLLQDAGNATTLVNYLEVLGESKLLIGLPKYVMDASRKYRTIPKLQVFNISLGLTYLTISLCNGCNNLSSYYVSRLIHCINLSLQLTKSFTKSVGSCDVSVSTFYITSKFNTCDISSRSCNLAFILCYINKNLTISTNT